MAAAASAHNSNMLKAFGHISLIGVYKEPQGFQFMGETNVVVSVHTELCHP